MSLRKDFTIRHHHELSHSGNDRIAQELLSRKFKVVRIRNNFVKLTSFFIIHRSRGVRPFLTEAVSEVILRSLRNKRNYKSGRRHITGRQLLYFRYSTSGTNSTFANF